MLTESADDAHLGIAGGLCRHRFVGSFGDIMLALGIVAIPAVAVPVLAYIARRYPSQAFLTQGRRPGGIRMYRWGLAVFGASIPGPSCRSR